MSKHKRKSVIMRGVQHGRQGVIKHDGTKRSWDQLWNEVRKSGLAIQIEIDGERGLLMGVNAEGQQ